MAFESFASRDPAAGRRRWVVGGSVAFHVALVTIGVLGSYWRVDELSPPTIMVTFRPPPAPPATEIKILHQLRRHALKGRDEGKKGRDDRPTQPVDRPRPILDKPIDETKDVTNPPIGTGGGSGSDDDGQGGQAGSGTGGNGTGKGDGDCTENCSDTGERTRVLPPKIAREQLIYGPDPRRPPAIVQLGLEQLVVAKICVSTSGGVSRVSIIKGADPAVDDIVVATVSTWRFRPFLLNDRPVPFCYIGNFSFRTQR